MKRGAWSFAGVTAALALLALTSPAAAKRTGMNLPCHNCHEGSDRPQVSVALSAARIEWFGLSEPDWLEAFSHHPRIGDRAALEARFPKTHDLSAKEQAGVAKAGEDVLTALAEGNNAYFDKFGFIFIVCATGKSAEEMLSLLRERLPHDRANELRIAAEEQAKITALRLS